MGQECNLHDKNHLCPYDIVTQHLARASKELKHTSNIHPFRSIGKLAIELIYGHVPHDKHKSYPWHERPLHP